MTSIDADLQRSVDKGHITRDQARAIMQDRLDEAASIEAEQPVSEQNHSLNQADKQRNHSLQDEPLKFIRSFSDIFISIGILVLFVTLLVSPNSAVINIASFAGLVVLSEWLVKRRHLVLPGMTLLVLMILFVHKIFPFDMSQVWQASDLQDASLGLQRNLLWVFGLSAIISGLYFWRYRLPFSVFTGGLSLLWLVLTWWQPENSLAFMWGAGMVVFLAAMLFDANDPRRVSYVSDVGFWLHLVAAPLLTHVFMILFGASIPALVFYLFMILVSLLVDRRAILLASVVYFVYNSFDLFGGGSFSVVFFFVMIGSLILLLGGFWYDIRYRLFAWVGSTPLGRWLPSFQPQQT